MAGIAPDIRFRWQRAKAARWLELDPILRGGEPGLEMDTGKFKIGNDRDPWSKLPYFITEEGIIQLVDERLLEAGSVGPDSTNLFAHIHDPDPHPAYDDGPSLLLLYQNAKV